MSVSQSRRCRSFGRVPMRRRSRMPFCRCFCCCCFTRRRRRMRQCQKGIEMCALYKKKDEKRDTQKKGGVMRSYFTHVASLAPTTKWLRRWLLCMTTTLSLCVRFCWRFGFGYKGALSFLSRVSMTQISRERRRRRRRRRRRQKRGQFDFFFKSLNV